MTLKTTCEKMSGGLDATTGVGKKYRLVFGGTWANFDTFTLLFTLSVSGLQVEIGAGRVTGVQPTFAFTFKRKIYILAGSTTYFCQLDTPTVWNDPNAIGAGSLVMVNNFASPEDLVAIAPYQGRLAFFTDRNIQIWKIDADPALNELQQVLPGTGALAKNSVVSLGELDVLFLSNSGVRSLRVRDSSLNAFINDLGSPIDALLLAVLNDAGVSMATKKAACALVDTAGRYWLFLKDTIYVLSYYPTNKIVAWGTYVPGFVPQKFLVGSVFTANPNVAIARTADGVETFTANSNICVVVGMWVDAKKPATMKQFKGFDVVLSGTWVISVCADPVTGTFQEVLNTNSSPFLGGRIAFDAIGTHLLWRGQTTDANATISSFIVHYEELEAS